MRGAQRIYIVAVAVGAFLTVSWLGVCAWYVEVLVGWNNLEALLPHELAMVIVGTLAPPIFLWLILILVVRGNVINEEVRALLGHMEAMTYPAEGTHRLVARITESLKDQASSLAEVSNEILGRLETMQTVFRQQSQELAGASVRAGSQAEQIREALQDQAAELTSANEKVGELITESREAVEAQIASLDEAAERAQSAASLLGENLEKPVGNLNQTADWALARSNDLNDVMQGQREAMNAIAAQSRTTSNAFRESLQEDLAALSEFGDKVEAQSGRFNLLIRDQVDRLNTVFNRTAAQARYLKDTMGQQHDDLSQLSNEVDEQVQAITESLRSESEDLRTVFEVSASRAKVMREAFEGQAANLAQAADGIADKLGDAMQHVMASVENTGERGAARLIEAASIVQHQIGEFGAAIKPETEAIAALGDHLAEQSRVAGEALDRQAENLGRVSGEAVARIDFVGEALQGRSAEMAEITQNAVDLSEQAISQFAVQGEGLASAADGVRAVVDELREAVQEEINELARLIADLSDMSEEIKGIAAEQSENLRDSATLARETSVVVRSEIHTQADEISETEELIQARLNRMGNRVEKVAALLAEISDRTIMKAENLGTDLESHAAILSGAIQEASSEIAQMTNAFERQSKHLVKASEMASTQALRLKEDEKKNRRDVFLRSATVMIEDLNATTIDLNRFMNEDIPDEVWRRYRRGDKSVFARRLLRMKDRFSIPDIEKRYESDERFRDQVTRYMGQFESLLSQATDCDPEHVLSATFLTADVGKLYLLLSRSLGRPH